MSVIADDILNCFSKIERVEVNYYIEVVEKFSFPHLYWVKN